MEKKGVSSQPLRTLVMRNSFLLAKLKPSHQFRLSLAAALIGAAMGIFFLHPVNEFVYYHEHEKFEPDPPTAAQFVSQQMIDSIAGRSPMKTSFYAVVGLLVGLTGAAIYNALHTRLLQIQQLSDELEKDLDALIQQGEGSNLEFKASFRWDFQEARVNRILEGVVLKTLAGFMNNSGGTLLIGVGDDGGTLGLACDYQTLKRPDRDGFEQALMAAIATNLGGDVCQQVRILFHFHEGKDVCRLIVFPAARPVFIQQGKDPKFYLRAGGGTRELNIQEAMEFIPRRWPK